VRLERDLDVEEHLARALLHREHVEDALELGHVLHDLARFGDDLRIGGDAEQELAHLGGEERRYGDQHEPDRRAADAVPAPVVRDRGEP